MRAAATAVALMIGLAGCASSNVAPDWLAAGPTAEEEGYPSLHEIPTGTSANVDPAHWAQLQQDLTSAGREVRANPRAMPPAPGAQTPQEFLDEARRELEETRQSHEP